MKAPLDANLSPIVAVVDDDVDIRVALADLFESHGFRANCYESAEDFLRDARHIDSACIISDYVMNGMSGLELARELKSRRSAVPFVLISAFVSVAINDRAADLGVSRVFEKPFDPAVLVSHVAHVTGGS
ncbi:response regulator transcription factor [Methylocella sp.]|uniref:response regulator transcription factor n=1 Tax=Methylocella sp. TaxID=1978226 RepID=UPI0037847399